MHTQATVGFKALLTTQPPSAWCPQGQHSPARSFNRAGEPRGGRGHALRLRPVSSQSLFTAPPRSIDELRLMLDPFPGRDDEFPRPAA